MFDIFIVSNMNIFGILCYNVTSMLKSNSFMKENIPGYGNNKKTMKFLRIS